MSSEHHIKLKVQFSESHPASETRQNISNNDTLPIIAHKLHRWYEDLLFSNKVHECFINQKVNIKARSAIPFNSVDVDISSQLSGFENTRIISAIVSYCHTDVYVKHIVFNANIDPSVVMIRVETNGPIAANTNIVELNIVAVKTST